MDPYKSLRWGSPENPMKSAYLVSQGYANFCKMVWMDLQQLVTLEHTPLTRYEKVVQTSANIVNPQLHTHYKVTLWQGVEENGLSLLMALRR